MSALHDGSAPDQSHPTQIVANNSNVAQSTAPQTGTGATSPAPQADVPATTPIKPTVMQSKQIGRYLVEVINDKCISAASCVAIAPAVFQLDEQNIAYVVSQDGHDDDTKLLAAQSCPTAAIIVTDTVTGKQVWPLED